MITFPRDMPPCRISELSRFDLVHGVAINQAGGSVQAMELAAPLWSAHFTSEPLDKAARAAVQAWWATLRGGMGTFYAFDCFRAYPAFYGAAVIGLPRATGGTFNGQVVIAANGITTVTLQTLPANYHFTDGDMLELPRTGGKLSLHQITEAGIGTAGGQAVVSIEPGALADTSVGAGTARLVKARCIMVPRPGSLDIPVGVGKRPASFEAVQTIR